MTFYCEQAHENTMSFPFGQEYETSTHQLFTSFCNNLHLGQWELARSYAQQLRDRRDVTGKDIDAIFISVFIKSICQITRLSNLKIPL